MLEKKYWKFSFAIELHFKTF